MNKRRRAVVGSGLRVFALCEEGEEATTTRATKDASSEGNVSC